MTFGADGDPGDFMPFRVQVVLRPICWMFGHARTSKFLLENPKTGVRRPWYPCKRCNKDLATRSWEG